MATFPSIKPTYGQQKDPHQKLEQCVLLMAMNIESYLD